MDPIKILPAPDSTQPGALRESASTYTDPEDVLRVYLSALTGIDKTLVRRRWLQKPGVQPSIETDWAAVGVDTVQTHGTPFHHGDKPATASDPDVKVRTSWQTLRCIASFYGPNAAELSDTFREGVQLQQNNNELKRYGLTIQGVDEDVRHLPDLLFEQWVDRYDVAFRVGRSVTRTFGVRTIASADLEIFTEKGKI